MLIFDSFLNRSINIIMDCCYNEYPKDSQQSGKENILRDNDLTKAITELKNM